MGIAILGIVGGAALFIVAALWEAYVLSLLWRWFVVPAFGLPPLTIPVAIGLALIVGMLTYRVIPGEDDVPLIERMTKMLITPGLLLAVGWAAQRWM